MSSVIRGVVVYLALLVIFRLAGKRSLAQTTTFDLVLLLIISESVSNALQGMEYSFTNALLLVLTLVGMDILMSLWKQRSPKVEKLLEGVPLVIVEQGKPLKERMEKARVDEDDILSAARQSLGLERMEQIKYAVLERSGGISVVPEKEQD